MGARAEQAETPNVFPERSMCDMLEDEFVSGSMYFSRSSLVSIFRPLPAREKVKDEFPTMIAGAFETVRRGNQGWLCSM